MSSDRVHLAYHLACLLNSVVTQGDWWSSVVHCPDDVRLCFLCIWPFESFPFFPSNCSIPKATARDCFFDPTRNHEIPLSPGVIFILQ